MNKILILLIISALSLCSKTNKDNIHKYISVKKIDSSSEEFVPLFCNCGYQPKGIVFDEDEPSNLEELNELKHKIALRDEREKRKRKRIKHIKNIH